MTKQEQIREELASKIYGIRMHLDNKTREEQADDILSYQDSKGLVFKVDRELPECWYDRGINGYTELHYIPSGLHEYLEEAGYVAVEPLVNNDD